MLATGRAAREDTQYPMATPSRDRGTLPASSTRPSCSHATAPRATGMKRCATRMTSPAAAAANRTAGTTAPARRTTIDAGRMRSKVAQGEARCSAMPTPNWKKAMPITAKTVKEAMMTFGLGGRVGEPDAEKDQDQARHGQRSHHVGGGAEKRQHPHPDMGQGQHQGSSRVRLTKASSSPAGRTSSSLNAVRVSTRRRTSRSASEV